MNNPNMENLKKYRKTLNFDKSIYRLLQVSAQKGEMC